jgi:ubiquinone/menaquinone biosynthesis C-methylase UbiE
MKNNDLYSIRFSDLATRNNVWKVLVKHFFQNYFSSEDAVLDIGCGYGEFINLVSCKKKIGLDIDGQYKKFLDKDVLFIRAFSHNIPLRDNSIDKIFISNVFEHLTRDDIDQTIHECRRILKKNGEVLILQPNIRYSNKDYWMFFDHITPIDDRALDEIFFTYHFTLIKKINKFLPLTTKSSLPKHPFFVIVYLALPLLWKIFGKQSFIIYRK